MTEQPTFRVPVAIESPLAGGGDLVAGLATALDIARNQFRAKQFSDAASAATRIAAKAESLISNTTLLSSEDVVRVKLMLACALTLEGRCLEEEGQIEKARDCWDRAISIFDADIPKTNPSADNLLYYGIALRMVGRRKEAIEIFRRAIDTGSAVVETYRHLGLVLKDEGSLHEAVEQFIAALKMSPSDLRSLRGLAESLEALGEHQTAARAYLDLAQTLAGSSYLDEAIQAVEESVRLNDTDAAVLQYQGDLLRIAGRGEEALRALDAALRLNPNDSVTLSIKGSTLYYLGLYEEALQALDAAVSANPNDAWAFGNKGLVLLMMNRYQEAEVALRESIRLNPTEAEAFARLAGVLVMANKPEEALRESESGLALNPAHALALTMRGLALAQLGKTAEALESFDASLKINDKIALTWSSKADSLQFLGREEEALTAFDRSLELNPMDSSVLSKRGRILCWSADKDRQAEGLGLLERALSYGPEPAVAEDIASNMLRLRDFEGALRAANVALDSEPGRQGALTTKADALQRLGHKQEALDTIEAALQAAPESAYLLGVKGQLLEKMDQMAEAERALQESVRIVPTADWVWLSLARVLIRLSRPEEGLHAAEQTLDLVPGNLEAVEVKADALLALNKAPESIAFLEKMAELNEKSPWIHQKLAELLEKEGLNEKALVELNKWAGLEPHSAAAHANRGYILHSIGNGREAEAALEEAVKLDDQLVWAYAELASVRRDLEKPDKALESVDRALELAPESPLALQIKGEILTSIAEYEAALDVLNQAIALRGTPYLWKGVALDCLERVTEAREAYEKSVELAPNDVWSMRAVADMLLLEGEKERGQKIFEEVIQKVSDQPRGLYEIGLCAWCHFGCDRLDLAIRLYSEALSMDRHGVLKSGQFDLALITTCTRRYSLAKREYQRAIELTYQAHPLLQKGLFSVAISDLKRAMRVRYPEIGSAAEVRGFLAKLEDERANIGAGSGYAEGSLSSTL